MSIQHLQESLEEVQAALEKAYTLNYPDDYVEQLELEEQELMDRIMYAKTGGY